MPLLAPLGIWLGFAWLSSVVVFGVFPILGLLIREDRSPPVIGLRRSRALVGYLDLLPRAYAVVWLVSVAWAASHAARAQLSAADLAGLALGIGIGSAVAVCAAHELMHRRSSTDVLLGRLMAAAYLYGHMFVEHLHHHATVGSVEAGETAPRGSSIYRFAVVDFLKGLKNAWRVETARLRRTRLRAWNSRVVQDYCASLVIALVFFGSWGPAGFVVFIGQAVFAVFVFEVITYVHHYGLVRGPDEEPGPQHAWAHHCWITNCLTFNNTFHSDHHLRPATPYYELHAMHGAPRLPASYFTMFCVALVPPLWRRIMDRRLDAFHEGRALGEPPADLAAQRCR